MLNIKTLPVEETDTENVNKQLIHLQNWIDANPNINAWKDVTNLLFFLRSCKYDLDRTKNKIKGFYLMRAERIEWFANRNPFTNEIQELLQLGVFLPLEGKDETNRQVIIIRTAVHNPKKHSQNDVMKVSKMILDLLLRLDPDISIHGLVAIFDMKGVQLGHALQMNPKLIKRSVDSWHVYPCKPKLLEFINTPPHVNIILNTFRFFMSNKMRSRLILSDIPSVKIGSLPKELGGCGPTYQELSLKWKHLVESNAEFFTEQEKYKSVLD